MKELDCCVLDCKYEGQVVQLKGVVVKISDMKIVVDRRNYLCTKCGYVCVVEADFELNYALSAPASCTNPDGCGSRMFREADGDSGAGCVSSWRHIQEMRLQDRTQWRHNNAATTVIVENELVNACRTGDEVLVSGTVVVRWDPRLAPGMSYRDKVDLVLRAEKVELVRKEEIAQIEDMKREFEQFWREHEMNPLVARDIVVASICPQLHQMYLVKLAVALVLAGGVRADGGSNRKDSHLLLVGDPGTGKSQFLRFAAQVRSPSVLTTGVGSTAAGLTCAAVKEEGCWQLEAGALVLADGGICCIDEFNSMKEVDRQNVHEAMEQQTLSVAKAGVVTKLNTRCSVLAAANAKGTYDPSQSLAYNTALGDPLLSRFDLILVLRDSKDSIWDADLADCLLSGRATLRRDGLQPHWPLKKLRAYFTIVRQLAPTLSGAAQKVLDAYYRQQRQQTDRLASRSTLRSLQSLVRLAQAHTKICFRTEVTWQDAVVAVHLMRHSSFSLGYQASSSVAHSLFPDDPDDTFFMEASEVLKSLGLEDLLLDPVVDCFPSDTSGVQEAGWVNKSANLFDEQSDEKAHVDDDYGDDSCASSGIVTSDVQSLLVGGSMEPRMKQKQPQSLSMILDHFRYREVDSVKERKSQTMQLDNAHLDLKERKPQTMQLDSAHLDQGSCTVVQPNDISPSPTPVNFAEGGLIARMSSFVKANSVASRPVTNVLSVSQAKVNIDHNQGRI